MGNEIFQVGVARADITPPIGIRLCGYTVREGFSHSVHAPLTATVLFIGGAGGSAAIIALDLALANLEWTQALRERCAAALGMLAGQVAINFNHTHSAPVVGRFWPQDSEAQLAMQSAYEEKLAQALEAACREASSAPVAARIATGWGECIGNINRRQKTPEGDMLMGEDPQGATDHSVGVLRFDRLDGTPLAVAFRFSCHTVTLGPRTNVISPDYPAAAREVVESGLDCPSLFLQGCGGNQNPITGIGQDTTVYEDTARLGQLLGSEVLKVCSGLRTHRRRGEATLIKSVAPYWMYGYDEIVAGAKGQVEVSEEWVELPLEPFAPMQDIEREREEWAARLKHVRQTNAREADVNVAVRFDYWLTLSLQAARDNAAGGPAPSKKFMVQVIRLGDIAIVCLPFEVMAETGTAIKAASPFAQTFVHGYTNAVITYLPTPQVSREGGMEARLGYKNYLLPTAIPGDWEPQLKDKVQAMLKQSLLNKEAHAS